MSTFPAEDLFDLNVRRLSARLPDLDLNAVVLMSPANFTYVTGAVMPAQRDIPERLSFAVIDTSGTVSVVICSIDEVPFRRENPAADATTYIEGEMTPAEALAQALEARGLAGGRVGFEANSMPVAAFRELSLCSPSTTFVEVDALLAELRSTKSELELDLIEAGCVATAAALYEGVGRFRLGETEARLALHIQDALESSGGRVQLINVVSGELTTVPNALARHKVIDRGAMIKVDLTGVFSGYLSDMARVFYAGSASNEQLKSYEDYVGLYRETLGSVRAERTAGSVFDESARLHRDRGLRFTAPHVGHGIGLALHDQPLLNPGNPHVLADGMALAVEPRCLLAPAERIHLEDIVVLRGGEAVLRSDLALLDAAPVIG